MIWEPMGRGWEREVRTEEMWGREMGLSHKDTWGFERGARKVHKALIIQGVGRKVIVIHGLKDIRAIWCFLLYMSNVNVWIQAYMCYTVHVKVIGQLLGIGFLQYRSKPRSSTLCSKHFHLLGHLAGSILRVFIKSHQVYSFLHPEYFWIKM